MWQTHCGVKYSHKHVLMSIGMTFPWLSWWIYVMAVLFVVPDFLIRNWGGAQFGAPAEFKWQIQRREAEEVGVWQQAVLMALSTSFTASGFTTKLRCRVGGCSILCKLFEILCYDWTWQTLISGTCPVELFERHPVMFLGQLPHQGLQRSSGTNELWEFKSAV